MKTRFIPTIVAIAVGLSLAGQAQVITPNPNLPVTYPDGVYRTPDQVHAQFNVPGLSIILSNIEHRAFGPVNSFPSGPNEIENFNSGMLGLVSVNGSPFQPVNGSGPVTTEVFGKTGNITGTFQTEMLSMNLSGVSPFGPLMIRESPTLPSLGQTSITDIGGGLYRIDSFFDVFTELSIDGGATWIPDSQGPARVYLTPTPEPSTFALVALGSGILAAHRSRQTRKQV